MSDIRHFDTCFVEMLCARGGCFPRRFNVSTLTAYSPADYADHAEGMQQAALFRRERQFEMVVRLLWFLWFVCDYQRDLRETLGFLCTLIEYARV